MGPGVGELLTSLLPFLLTSLLTYLLTYLHTYSLTLFAGGHGREAVGPGALRLPEDYDVHRN